MVRSMRSIGCSLVMLALVTSRAHALPTTNPTNRPAILKQNRDNYLRVVRALPLLDKRRICDLMQLRVEGAQLVLETSLQPWGTFEGRRVEIEGLPSPASLTYAQFVAHDPAARQFELKFEEYPDNDLFGQFRLQWRPSVVGHGGEMTIEMAEQTSRSFHRIFYMQSAPMARLLVFANDSSVNHNLQSFNLIERDFQTLRQRHPTEVQEWLRPIFHRLQQDAIFAPDVNAAWQVLASRWPATDQVREKVIGLLPDLGSDQFRVRLRTADQLAALGRDGASTILRLDRSGMSLEQNARLDEVVARFRRMQPGDARRMANSADFLLDCQYCEDATVRRLAGERLEEVVGHPLNLDSNAVGPARLNSIEKLRLQLHPRATSLPSN